MCSILSPQQHRLDQPGPVLGKVAYEVGRLVRKVWDEDMKAERRLLAVLREAYGLQREPDNATLEGLSEAWRPYRMWVCVCLRRSGGEGAGMMHSRASG